MIAVKGEYGESDTSHFNSYRVDERVIDEMIGLCRGITADGEVNQNEAEFLIRWMENNVTNTDDTIISQLYRRIKEMLADGVLDNSESIELLDLLQMFTGDKKSGEVAAQLTSTLPLDTPPPVVEFENKYFCLTGKFVYGPRKACEEIIISKGGQIKTSVSGWVDYLVLGFFASPDWIHSSYGRKIEAAVCLRESDTKRKQIHIVDEDTWAKYAFAG